MENTARLKIATWNINGIRSFSPPELKDQLDSLDADIVCLQETKITREAIDESSAVISGYDSFFSFSKSRSGYSGVATFCKQSALPVKAEDGLTGILSNKQDSVACYGDVANLSVEEKRHLDSEGRTVITQHHLQGGGLLTVINVYCPRADPERPDRLEFKLNFYSALQARCKALIDSGSNVIILGDINCSHQPIDHCDPGDLSEFVNQPSRQWLDCLLKGEADVKLIDTFRHLHPNKRESFSCWNTKVGARNTNYGTRIDYILCDPSICRMLRECHILSEVMGSDHCPVVASFEINCLPASCPPALCTRFFPEFSGVQQTLHAFLQPKKLLSQPNNASSSNKLTIKRKQAGIQDFFGPKTKTTKQNVFTSVPDQATASSTSNGNGTIKNNAMERSATAQVASALAWKSVLRGPPPAPLCDKHKEKCVLRTVKKAGPNFNRQFFCCSRSEGHKSNPEARCDFFKWIPK